MGTRAKPLRSTILPYSLADDTVLAVYQQYASFHSRGTARIGMRLARALDMTDHEVESVRLACMFHDIGKLGIDAEIVSKPTRLDAREWRIIRTHPDLGAEMFDGLPGYQRVAAAIRFHHENWDGSGYPLGLRGEEIPLDARIVSISDAFHAMTSHRAYAPAFSTAEALRALQEEAGVKRDPELVACFCREIGTSLVA